MHFVDDDAAADQKAQDTLRDIALAAGYREVGFQYEPIAAAFDYESRIAREELVLIADIGGGTSDFSLIRLSPERARKTDRRADILASGGIHIGGTDFDKYLSLSCVMPQLGLGTKLKNNAEMPSTCYFNLATWHTINLAYTQRVERELLELARDAREPARLDLLLQLIRQRGGHWMALQVEAAKIALCDNGAATLTLDRLRPVLVQPLARPDFDAAIAHLTASVEHSVRAMLREAGVDASQVDTIFFTGGSSAVPLLRQKIAAAAPMARQAEGDLFKSIGAGLALDAARRFT